MNTHPRIRLGRTNFMVSPVGFGGYRIDLRTPTHREALTQALLSGCNLIDTSTNYTNGESEKLVGEVLDKLIGTQKLKRNEVVVVTKAGYVQGDNLELVRARLAEKRAFAEMVEYHEDCWHCISPEFLEDQITRSLGRLKLKQIDVLLLHNPEYFLKVQNDHAEYYRRIKKAFEYLETEVKKGRIQFYGISSNSFPESNQAADYTSLETVIELAEQISAEHHFAVIQFPFNLYEPGAALEQNNSGKTVTQLVQTKDLGSLVNRPLNAFDGTKMIRLADFPMHIGVDLTGNFKKALQAAIELEGTYPGKSIVPIQRVAWGHILNSNIEKIKDLESWRQILGYEIRPILNDSFERLLEANEACAEWVTKYQTVSSALFASFTQYMESRAGLESQHVHNLIDEACPKLKNTGTLSQKVLRIYRSIPGIQCVLVGMRRPEYVIDSLHFAEPLKESEAMDVLWKLSK